MAWVRKWTIPTERPRLSAKLVPTFVDRGCHVVSVIVLCGRILGFLDWSHYFFFQVATQLYSWGWVDPVPDPLLLRKSGSAGNRTWTSRPRLLYSLGEHLKLSIPIMSGENVYKVKVIRNSLFSNNLDLKRKRYTACKIFPARHNRWWSKLNF
jgi:hypothetical protein